MAVIMIHPLVIIHRVQRREDRGAVCPVPDPDIERDSDRRSPGEFLCGEAIDAAVGQNGRQRSGEAETVRQHEVRPRHAEVFAEKLVAVHHLPDNRLLRGNVHVALFQRRAVGVPVTRRDIFFQCRVVRRIVLLHKLVPIRAGPVENIIRVLLKQGKVLVQGVGNELVDDLRIAPAPFGVQMRVSDRVQRRRLGEVGFRGRSLAQPRRRCAEEGQKRGQRRSDQPVLERNFHQTWNLSKSV